MRVAVDTNVLVRAVVRDDPKQARVAANRELISRFEQKIQATLARMGRRGRLKDEL